MCVSFWEHNHVADADHCISSLIHILPLFVNPSSLHGYQYVRVDTVMGTGGRNLIAHYHLGPTPCIGGQGT